MFLFCSRAKIKPLRINFKFGPGVFGFGW